MAKQNQSRLITFLIDHNIEGQAEQLWRIILEMGWLDVVQIRFLRLRDVGLREDSSDRDVWRYAQASDMLLLTDNRNRENPDSLEETIRQENTSYSLPVLTIGKVRRLLELEYRQECVEKLIEIALYLDDYIGVGRLYIP